MAVHYFQAALLCSRVKEWHLENYLDVCQGLPLSFYNAQALLENSNHRDDLGVDVAPAICKNFLPK